MARRFIVKEENIKEINDELIEIFGEEVKHIQVLRKNVEDIIHVNDSMYEIVKMGRESIELKFIEKAVSQGVPQVDITLYIAFLKQDKMDYVVQKAVETGVKRIVPFFSTNVIVKLDDKNKVKRREKLQKIADEACKQCGRTDAVLVDEFINFNELLKDVENTNVSLFAYEASKDSLKTEINAIKENNFENIGIIIGAEGGFTPSEAEKLKDIEKVKCVSLGTRILRAETAAINLVSIVEYEMEE